MSRDTITVYRRKESSWYWYAYYVNGKRRMRSGKIFGLNIHTHTPEEATAALYKLLGRVPPSTELLYDTLLNLKKSMIKRLEREGIRETTVKEYRLAMERLIAIFGESYKTADISKRDIDRIQARLLNDKDNPLAPTTVNKILRHLQGIFSRLCDDEIIPRNPFAKFKKLRVPPRPRSLKGDQLVALFEAMAKDAVYTDRYRVTRILAHTGRRLKEITELSRDEIDIKNARILVTDSKDRGEPEKYWIPIPKAVMNDVRVLCEAERLLPFHICHPDTLSHWIKKHLKAIGLGHLRCHDLRHTFVTLAGESGVDLWRIQRQVGHSSIQVTEGYFHGDHTEAIDLNLDAQTGSERNRKRNSDKKKRGYGSS